MQRRFKIIIRRIEKPFSDELEEEIDWICQTLGFFERVDRDKTASAIIKELIQNEKLTSSDISRNVQMSRGAVINHLNNLMRSGLISRSGRFYEIRSQSIFRTIEEIEDDIERILTKIKKAARTIDQERGLIIKE